MKPAFIQQDWRRIELVRADALADFSFTSRRRVSDDEAENLFVPAAARLREIMLRKTVPYRIIKMTLDAMTEAFERRLTELDVTWKLIASWRDRR